jgi:uncharacterized membrane protein (UPF0127 family)
MSRRKDAMSWGLIVLVLLAVGVTALYVMWPQLQPHTSLKLGDGVFTARVAKTQDELDKGLGGTHKLREDQAMLFVYSHDDKWKVTMKDMNFPVDAVWLDADKKVVYIVKNVPPESYPYEDFTPKEKARYVVEFPEGTIGPKAISIGTVATFDENNIQGLKL